MDGNVHGLHKALQMQSLLVGCFLVVQPKGLKKDLPRCLSWLLLLAIKNENGLPLYVCRNCLETLKTAQSIESKLQRFCEVAQESLRKLQVQGSKCPKDSTGVGASSYSQKHLQRLRTWCTIMDTRGDNMPPDSVLAKSKRSGNTS